MSARLATTWWAAYGYSRVMLLSATSAKGWMKCSGDGICAPVCTRESSSCDVDGGHRLRYRDSAISLDSIHLEFSQRPSITPVRGVAVRSCPGPGRSDSDDPCLLGTRDRRAAEVAPGQRPSRVESSGPVTGRGHSGEVRVEHGHQRRVHHLRISEAGVVGDVDRSGGVAEDFRAEPEPFAFDRRGENAIVRHVPDQRHGVDVPLTQPLGHIGVGVYGAEFLDHGLPAVLSTPENLIADCE